MLQVWPIVTVPSLPAVWPGPIHQPDSGSQSQALAAAPRSQPLARSVQEEHEAMNQRIKTRFWSKVCALPTGCWVWLGYRKETGYGRFNFNGVVIGAHRAAWLLVHGPIPSGLVVLHRCDTPECVNPAHLFLGTQQENMADMRSKGREARGSRHGQAKITEADLILIQRLRAQGKSQYAIAKVIGLNQSQISRILSGKAWRRLV